MVNLKISGMALAVAALLAGCGGGGGSASTGTSNYLGGTIAMGAPIAGATVIARDANGRTSNAVTADENGKYTGLDLTGLVAPIMIEATGQVGQTPYKLYTPLASTSAGTANVTTLTTALAGAIGGGDPDGMSLSAITAAGIEQAKTLLATALGPVASALNLNLASTDMVGSAFDANSTGIDKLLDLVDIRVRADGISMVNRLQPVAEDQASSDRTELRISTTGQVTGALPSVQDISLSWQQNIANQFTQCFALPAAQRVTYVNDAGGVPTPTSLHSSCQSFVDNSYLHNSYTFGERWMFALKDPAFDNAKFKVQLAYLVTEGGTTLYVANIHTADSSGNGYTRPEVITENSGTYKLRGNLRTVDAFAQPLIAKISDYANPDSASNSIAGRLSFMFSPHRDYDSTTSSYKFFYDGNGKPQPRWVCAWVTGPGLPGEGTMNAQNTGPVGGILMKVPRSDYVALRSYMAVHVKFPATFDPTSVQEDRNQLLKACAARENVAVSGPASWETGSWSTFNFFTIDAAKTHQASAFQWPTSSSYNWASNSTSWGQAVGTSYSSWALSPVGAQVKATYKPTSMPLYTFHAFRVSDLPAANSMYTVSGYGSIPVIDNTMGDAFFAAKVVMKTRMLGAMPYLSTDANGVYNGNVRFGSLASTTLSNFLSAGATDINAGGTLSAAWNPAAGATGMDRVGFTCYANWTPAGGSKKRWGPSVASGSFGVPRNITSGTFTLDDKCLGLGAQAALPGSINIPSTSMYRDIWIRTYDQENRQIQQVMLAER